MKPNWTGWIQSEEGKRAANINTLYPNSKDGSLYLENRLWSAFVAGAEYERSVHSLARVCTNCGRPSGEHSKESLVKANPHNWKWKANACPVGAQPFHPTQTFTDRGEL